MAKYHGRRGVVYLSSSGTGTAVNVANLSEWSLEITTDRVEVTAFGDANKTYVQGLKDVTGSFTGYFGIFMGMMALLACSSEGTPFAMNQAPWVVFACMLAAYFFGWAIARIMSRIAGVR